MILKKSNITENDLKVIDDLVFSKIEVTVPFGNATIETNDTAQIARLKGKGFKET